MEPDKSRGCSLGFTHLYSLSPMIWRCILYQWCFYSLGALSRNKYMTYSWPGFGTHNYFCFLRLLLQYKVNLIFITILTAIVWPLLHFLLQFPNHTSLHSAKRALGCPFSLSDIWGGLFLPPSVGAPPPQTFSFLIKTLVSFQMILLPRLLRVCELSRHIFSP